MSNYLPKKSVWMLRGSMGLIIAICFYGTIYASSVPTSPDLYVSDQDTIPRHTVNPSQIDPEPEVGLDAYFKYIDKNYKIPKEARRARKNGVVLIDFTIEADGSIANVKVEADLGNGTGEEGVRVIKDGPKWKPGTLDGVPVRTAMRIPIPVRLPPSLKDAHRAKQTSEAIRKMTR